MEFLYFLESIRTPVVDGLMQLITELGSEMLFIIIGLAIFWCVDKKQGYFVLLTGFFGVYINQYLKLICRIPRPWVIDPDFTIVESARAGATGYSFPSGHTQTSVGCFAGIAICRRETWLRVICIALCVLVPFSRMYLGVHTPLDVGVSVVVALCLCVGLWWLFSRFGHGMRLMLPLLGALSLLAVSFLLYCELWQFPADIDPVNLESALKNAYTLLGALIGLWVTYLVDERHTHFETRATWQGQLIKLLAGAALTLLVMEGSKPLFNLIFGTEGQLWLIGRTVRYFLTVMVAGVLWPMTFQKLAVIGKK